MPPDFDPIPGAAGFQMSNPSVLAVISLHGALQVTQEAISGDGLVKLRNKSELLTAYLEKLLTSTGHYIKLEDAEGYDGPPGFTIITPTAINQRGAQLSLLFLPRGKEIMEAVAQFLSEAGVIGDERKPDVLRLAPVPLYNTFADVREAAAAVFNAVQRCRRDAKASSSVDSLTLEDTPKTTSLMQTS
jgi:kynureninase